MFVPCPRLISRSRLVIRSRSWCVGRAASRMRRSASDSSSSVPRITEPKSTKRFRQNSAANRSRASRSALRSGAGNRRLGIILTPHGFPPGPSAYRNSKRDDRAWPTARQSDAPRHLRVMQTWELSPSLRTGLRYRSKLDNASARLARAACGNRTPSGHHPRYQVGAGNSMMAGKLPAGQGWPAYLTNFLLRTPICRCDKAYSLKPPHQRVSASVDYAFGSAHALFRSVRLVTAAS